jgi:16S rRNA (cytosine1402-N4)-methyltransferase
MLDECINALQLKPKQIVVDATIGAAGHSREIIKRIKGGRLVGLDKDDVALKAVADILCNTKEADVCLIKCNFADIENNLTDLGIDQADAVLADFGMASYQIDNSKRGFSYMNDGPLDMRMDRDQKITADDVVNRYDEKKLANIIYTYGEERYSRRIAAAIVKNRPITMTLRLAEIIKSAVPQSYGKTGGHPAKRTFQAIRIEVNQELLSIEKFLDGAIKCLKPGGRLAVIAFHSLEDRIVKQKFRLEATDCICRPKIIQCVCGHKASVKLLTKKPIYPTIKEIESNPRSASAKLRIVAKLG